MRTKVTYGVVRRMELSSPSGNIRLSSTCPANSSAIAIPMSTRGASLRRMHHLAACPSAKAPLPLSAHEALPLLCDRRRPHLAEPRVRLSARYPHCCHPGQRRRGRRVLRRLPLPNLFRRLFGEGAFNAAFVPLFAKRLEGEGREVARQFAEEAMAGLVFILLILTIIAEITMPFLMYGLAPGFSETRRSSTSRCC